jgi:hypothetical protein
MGMCLIDPSSVLWASAPRAVRTGPSKDTLANIMPFTATDTVPATVVHARPFNPLRVRRPKCVDANNVVIIVFYAVGEFVGADGRSVGNNVGIWVGALVGGGGLGGGGGDGGGGLGGGGRGP